MGPPSPDPTGPKLGHQHLKKPPIPHCGIAFHIVEREPCSTMWYVILHCAMHPYNHDDSKGMKARAHCGILEC
jgi:hypothetical protein